ncbi:Era GTPase [Candidatus Kinetoplastibacterium blastocrithidii TCC012E]|uniref:GTPase Era n=1 Tax=Candidatus Kinetoplastidibacterium blastocrithidiae TCC012E TaxID=1208922 RepID=M1LWH7_9PROT|nr:GTPase Era [Candidatus Kinetoplastibacterium blastocrithidii]AFZ83759.1 GTP-binding protein Era [Candidatus Kinetoplastibacterium blastocrithidii (ex Strigomonas culicis)]AGF49882.1 Era GTPase [Candidatus Kinetoplastibacterium blastocrithidii TCC012E]
MKNSIEKYKSGFIAIIGCPNVGKSTLNNALIGEKISIVSKKAQTTRHKINGVLTRGNEQFVFVDTPGFQIKYVSTMTRMMNRLVSKALMDVDIVVHVIEACKWNNEDNNLLEIIPKFKTVLLAINKIDLLKDKNLLLPFINNATKYYPYSSVIPISASKKYQLEPLLHDISKYLPYKEKIFDDDVLTDRPAKFFVSEIIREKVFRLVGDEIPYKCAVIIEKWDEQANLVYIYACIIVERITHRAILLGSHGLHMKRIATESRQDIVKLLDKKVYLEIYIKVCKNWSNKKEFLEIMGYE